MSRRTGNRAGNPRPPLPPPPPSRWQDFSARLRRTFNRRRLPGWVYFVLGAIIQVPDWSSRAAFWRDTADHFGIVGMIPFAFGSLYFGPALMVIGIGYVMLVGEPNKGVLRAHWWPYVGWTTASVLFVAVLMSAEAGYLFSFIHAPRNLSAAQRAIITTEIRPIAKQFTIPVTIYAERPPESIGYSLEIESALISGGLILDLGNNLNLMPKLIDGNAPGVFMQVKDPLHPPILAQKLMKVLSDANIPVGYVYNYDFQPQMFALTIGVN